MKHLELFSGIGGFRRAIDLICKDKNINAECVAFSEKDVKALITYRSNYDINNEIEIGDIVEFTKDKKNIESLPNFDLLTGGFPCQTFSMMGSQTGFNEDRGQLFFRIIDILKIKRSKYVLLENVQNIVKHNHGKTIRRICKELEDIGYITHWDIFNTSDYGLPQKRNRTIIFARRKEYGDFAFNQQLIKKTFDSLDKNTLSIKLYDKVIDMLEKDVNAKYYLSEKIKPTILSDGSGGFKSNSEIDMDIARPLTASMHKMHRACQDNYYSDIYIESHGSLHPTTWMSKDELSKIPIRKLTPAEAFLLQGFPNEFVRKARINGVNDGALYKQAGNAVSINMIYAVLNYLISEQIIQL